MAGIRKVVKLELTDEEITILRKASEIIDEIAEEDGADIVFDLCDNHNDGLWFISSFLTNMIDNS